MRESQLQSQIINLLEKEGWLVVKIIQTNKNGWPDLQIHRFGITIFIEVKTEKGKLSKLQEYRHKQLQDAGFYVFTIHTLNQLKDEFTTASEKLRSERVIGNLN